MSMPVKGKGRSDFSTNCSLKPGKPAFQNQPDAEAGRHSYTIPDYAILTDVVAVGPNFYTGNIVKGGTQASENKLLHKGYFVGKNNCRMTSEFRSIHKAEPALQPEGQGYFEGEDGLPSEHPGEWNEQPEPQHSGQ